MNESSYSKSSSTTFRLVSESTAWAFSYHSAVCEERSGGCFRRIATFFSYKGSGFNHLYQRFNHLYQSLGKRVFTLYLIGVKYRFQGLIVSLFLYNHWRNNIGGCPRSGFVWSLIFASFALPFETYLLYTRLQAELDYYTTTHKWLEDSASRSVFLSQSSSLDAYTQKNKAGQSSDPLTLSFAEFGSTRSYLHAFRPTFAIQSIHWYGLALKYVVFSLTLGALLWPTH